MLLADARLPTGAHTQSAGLEPALRAGVPASAVPAYILARLRTVTAVEAGAAVLARARTVAAATDPELDLAVALARWTRRGGQGRSARRCVRRRYCSAAGTPGWSAASGREHQERRALAAIGRPGRAVVLGVAAALAGLSAAQLVRLIGYDDAQTVAAATLKLEPLDPVVATGWVMAAGAGIERWSATWRD